MRCATAAALSTSNEMGERRNLPSSVRVPGQSEPRSFRRITGAGFNPAVVGQKQARITTPSAVFGPDSRPEPINCGATPAIPPTPSRPPISAPVASANCAPWCCSEGSGLPIVKSKSRISTKAGHAPVGHADSGRRPMESLGRTARVHSAALSGRMIYRKN